MIDMLPTDVDHSLEAADTALSAMHATWQVSEGRPFADRYVTLEAAHCDALVRDEALLWNVYARTYDALEHLRSYQALQDQAVSLLAVSGVRDMVDLGCGPALLERRLAREGQLVGTQVRCFELSDAMRAEAAERTFDWESAGVDISFAAHDLNNALPLPPATVDRIVCTNVLGFLSPDRAQSLIGEIRRALRPGGRFVLTTQQPDFDLGHILREQAGASHSDDWSLRQHPEHLPAMLTAAMQRTDPAAHEALAYNMLANVALLRANAGSVSYTPGSEELRFLLEGQGFTITHQGAGYADQYHVFAAEAGSRPHMRSILA